MTILLDCDVLIDVAANRAPHARNSHAVLEWVERHPGSGFVAEHTIANLYYVLRKHPGDALTREFIEELLDFVEVVAAGTPEVKHALALPMTDLEDALQSAAAVHAGVDFIVTRNIGDYKNSPIQALLPADFLAQAPA